MFQNNILEECIGVMVVRTAAFKIRKKEGNERKGKGTKGSKFILDIKHI